MSKNLEKIIENYKKNNDVKRVIYRSKFNMKGYQLKNIIEQYNELHPDNIIKVYKSKSIKELDNLITKFKIRIPDYNIAVINPYKVVNNILKKAGIQQYEPNIQELYLEGLSLNEHYKNPLHALNLYTNKEGKKEFLSPLKHQKDFILSFIYSTLRGAVVFHGVGSGKTLTAVISSYYYLKMYPKNKVIVISPSALLFNFVAGMVQYGLDKNDNRYSFYTYDKYCRNPQIAKDSLLIIDEAHNFRTEIVKQEIRDPSNINAIIDTTASSNMKGFKIMKFGSSYCHKIILLTGTAFVNVLSDIENLLAMVDNREPVSKKNYDFVMDSIPSVKDYFDYKISYFKKADNDENFPERRDAFVPIVMSDAEEKEYKRLKNEGSPNNTSEQKNAFYSAEKYASNMIGGINNPKIKFIIDKIVANPKEKFIIYSGLYDSGISGLSSMLTKNNIEHTMITGRQNTTQKEQSKLNFNYYNFDNKNFFNQETISNDIKMKYENNKYRVMLISRAGAEGVDTINCQNIIILDGQWNDALSEQIIARAIRFKSHIGLPSNQQHVNVIRPIYCFSSDKKLTDKIISKNCDFRQLKEQIKSDVFLQLQDMKKKEKRYIPTLKELKTLKDIDGKIFIPDNTISRNIKGMYGRSGTKIIDRIGWNSYKGTVLQKKEWKIAQYYKWYVQNNNNNNDNKDVTLHGHSIDLYLYVLSKAKQATIDEFVATFSNSTETVGNGIETFEKYESKLMKTIKSKEKLTNKILTEEEKINLFRKLHKEETNEILKNDNLIMNTKNERNKKNQLQQFYTNALLAKYIYETSSLKNNKQKDVIKILEPTAGIGDLILPIVQSNKNVSISMVEIDPENRTKLNELIAKYKVTLRPLSNQHNFLIYYTSERFNYIFMNPPFHLRKREDYNLIRDTYDFDFVKKAFGFLKKGGELYAIVDSENWKKNKSFMEWTKKTDNKIFDWELVKKGKFSGIIHDTVVIKLTKLKEEGSESEDSDLIFQKFYVNQNDKGKELNNNELSYKAIINENHKPDNKRALNSYKKSDAEEIRELEAELDNILKTWKN